MSRTSLVRRALATGLTVSFAAVPVALHAATPAAATTDTLAAWHAALANSTAVPTNVVFIGDSITEGYYAPDRTDRWVDLVRGQLQSDYGGAGAGYLPAADGAPTMPAFADVWSGAGGSVSTTTGLGLRSDVLQGQGAYAQATVTADEVQLAYMAGPNGGAMRVTIDGQQAAVVDTYAATYQSGRTWNSGPLTPGSHTVRVVTDPSGTLAGTYAVVLEGMMVFDGDERSGVRTWESGHAGYLAQSFSSNGFFGGDIAQTAADLVVIELGVNDTTAGVTPSTYEANLATLMDTVEANDPHSTSFLLLAAIRPAPVAAATYQPYVDAMRDLATTRSVGFLDLSQMSDPTLLSADGYHPNAVGGPVMANAVLNAIDPVYVSQPAPPLPAPPSGPVTSITATATTTTSAALTWTPAPAPPRTMDTYVVKALDMSTAPPSVTTTTYACGSCTQAVVSNLTAGHAYAFSITPHNAGGYGPAGSSATIATAAPGLPTNVVASLGPATGTVTATWTAPGGLVDGYLVQTYEMPAGKFVFSQTATGPSATVTGLTPGHSYAVCVWAHNTTGYSANCGGSNTVMLPPSAPTNVVAKAQSGAKATVTWTAPYGTIDSYVVQTYDLTLNKLVSQHTATTTALTVSGLTVGHAYAFAVWAHDAGGYGPSAGSNTVTATR